MGADLAYMGTRFINTKNLADEDYKMINDSTANDIVYTAAVSVNANFLRPSLEAMGITEDMWNKSKKIDLVKNLLQQQRQKHGKPYGLQVKVTSIDDCPSVEELVSNLKEEFINSIEEQSAS